MTHPSFLVMTVLDTALAVLAMGQVATAEPRFGSGSGHPRPLTAPAAQSPQNPNAARAVEWDGKDLRTRLLPSDSRVVVVRSVGPPLMSLPADTAEELKVHVQRADAVVVLRPTAVVGTLTERADWISSTVTADVIEILKSSPKHPLRIGSSVQVSHGGGEVTLEGKQIRAVDEGDTLPELDQDYLYFLFGYEGTLHAFPLRMTFRLTDAGVQRLGPGPSTAALSARAFLSMVRERVALGRK